MTLPRGLILGTGAAITLAWGLFALDPRAWPGIAGPIGQTALFLANLLLTARSRRVKVLIVRALQRWAINPLIRSLLAIGLNPLGLAILETTGRVSGQPRRNPVGNGRTGDTFWIIAEHGFRAGYVRNIQRDPRVRIRLRVGWRQRWVSGIAEVLPDDDPLATQRRIIAWHPLRAFNAMNVRILGADLLTVRVQLLASEVTASALDTGHEPQAPGGTPRHRQRDQLAVARQGLAATSAARRGHLIVDQHIERGQEVSRSLLTESTT